MLFDYHSCSSERFWSLQEKSVQAGPEVMSCCLCIPGFDIVPDMVVARTTDRTHMRRYHTLSLATIAEPGHQVHTVDTLHAAAAAAWCVWHAGHCCARLLHTA